MGKTPSLPKTHWLQVPKLQSYLFQLQLSTENLPFPFVICVTATLRENHKFHRACVTRKSPKHHGQPKRASLINLLASQTLEI
jgi:hypothetical protein